MSLIELNPEERERLGVSQLFQVPNPKKGEPYPGFILDTECSEGWVPTYSYCGPLSDGSFEHDPSFRFARRATASDLPAEADGLKLKAVCRDTCYPGGEWPRDRHLQWDIEGLDEPDGRGRFYQKDAVRIVEALTNHDHLTAEVRRLTDEVARLKEERDRLLSIKRLFTHDCNKIIELIEWSKKGNGNLDLEWAADQVGNALSNAHLIDIGAYRPGVFMPTGSEEATALTSP